MPYGCFTMNHMLPSIIIFNVVVTKWAALVF
jgi:hypothetical protein